VTNVLHSLSLLALGRPSTTAARRSPALTWAALAPLTLGDLPEPIGRRRHRAGMGAREFAWSTLVLELLDPPSEASRSYLEANWVMRSNPASTSSRLVEGNQKTQR
jgi:hypothetical protein